MIKGLRILLFALCGALALAAVVLFFVQWNEGETASRNARTLLDASGIKLVATATESAPGTQPTDTIPDSVPSTQTPTDTAVSVPPRLKGYKVIARPKE